MSLNSEKKQRISSLLLQQIPFVSLLEQQHFSTPQDYQFGSALTIWKSPLTTRKASQCPRDTKSLNPFKATGRVAKNNLKGMKLQIVGNPLSMRERGFCLIPPEPLRDASLAVRGRLDFYCSAW